MTMLKAYWSRSIRRAQLYPLRPTTLICKPRNTHNSNAKRTVDGSERTKKERSTVVGFMRKWCHKLSANDVRGSYANRLYYLLNLYYRRLILSRSLRRSSIPKVRLRTLNWKYRYYISIQLWITFEIMFELSSAII